MALVALPILCLVCLLHENFVQADGRTMTSALVAFGDHGNLLLNKCRHVAFLVPRLDAPRPTHFPSFAFPTWQKKCSEKTKESRRRRIGSDVKLDQRMRTETKFGTRHPDVQIATSSSPHKTSKSATDHFPSVLQNSP